MSKVRVAVRVRPQNERERDEGANLCVSTNVRERLVVINEEKAFKYNYVFDENIHQDELYQACVRDARPGRDLIGGLFDGYNATVFAYGQTGSGKTYTMGTAYETNTEETMGIIHRAVRDIFDEFDDRRYASLDSEHQPQFELSVQFIELYNEEILDLLAIGVQKIDIYSHRDEIQLRGATTYPVSNLNDIMKVLKTGSQNRTTAATMMNENSSRSHAIFTVILKQIRAAQDNSGQLEELSAKFQFVDLAGSEGLKKTGATGERANEGISINRGLLELGNVIQALSERAAHIPYRNCKLTHLLKGSLGGNSRTLMIACVGPSDSDLTETTKTLGYAYRAMSINNKNNRQYRLLSANPDGDAHTNTDSQSSIPPMTDTANIPYPRSQWMQWYNEVAHHVPSEPMEMDIGADVELPSLTLRGPDDVEGIARIRAYFSAETARRRGYEDALEENEKLFEAKLKQRLCIADLDRARVVALEEEVRKLKAENSTKTGELRQLKRENVAYYTTLRRYEAAQKEEQHRDEGYQRYLDQERKKDQANRRTMQKIAELFENPIPTTTNVARLRKMFGADGEEENIEEEEGTSALCKTPKLVHPSALPKTPQAVQFSDKTNQQAQDRFPSRIGAAGFVNPKYGGANSVQRHRRSRSVGGTPRVLNHVPVHKIPLGTVHQPKLPRTTKHTSQVEAGDLRKHEQYLITRQEVDERGNVRTRLFKGDVCPTAGGGSAVRYTDVENLTQESPDC